MCGCNQQTEQIEIRATAIPEVIQVRVLSAQVQPQEARIINDEVRSGRSTPIIIEPRKKRE